MHQRSPRAVGVLAKRQSATSPDYLSCETEKREGRELGAKTAGSRSKPDRPFCREPATSSVIGSARPSRASSPRSQWTISSPGSFDQGEFGRAPLPQSPERRGPRARERLGKGLLRALGGRLENVRGVTRRALRHRSRGRGNHA
jgi:hypothetical protein